MEPTSLAAAVADVNLQVTPENVLDVRRILLTEADRLWRFHAESMGYEGVGLCGGDPVSAQAARAFNARIDRLLEQSREYAQQLRAAGENLGRIAQQYGYAEAEIENSYRSLGPEMSS